MLRMYSRRSRDLLRVLSINPVILLLICILITMTTYTSGSTSSTATIRRIGDTSTGTLGSMAPRVIGSSTNSNPLLAEVDAELKKLKTQFDTMKNDPVLQNKGTTINNPETNAFRSNYSSNDIQKPSTGLNSSYNNYTTSYSNSYNTDSQPSYGGSGNRFTQSFEIKKDIQKPTTGNLTSSYTSGSSSSYAPMTVNKSSDGISRPNVLKSETTNRVVDSSFDGRRIDGGQNKYEVKTLTPSKTYEPTPQQGYAASPIKQANKFQIKKLDTNTQSYSNGSLGTHTFKQKLGSGKSSEVFEQPKTITSNSQQSFMAKPMQITRAQPLKSGSRLGEESRSVPKPQTAVPSSYDTRKVQPLRYQPQRATTPVTETRTYEPQRVEPLRVEAPRTSDVSRPTYSQQYKSLENSKVSSSSTSKVGGTSSGITSSQVKHEPTKLPEPTRFEPTIERLQYERPLDSPRESVRSERDLSGTPSRREQDESIRKMQAKRYADQQQKTNTLAKNIDTVNRENAELKHQIIKLTSDVNSIEGFKEEIANLRTLVKERDQRIRELTASNEEYEIKLRRLHEYVEDTRRQSAAIPNVGDSETAFNSALKAHMEENQRIKDKLVTKDEQIDNLREQIKTIQAQSDNYRHEIEIQKLKHMAELKNSQTNNEIETQRLVNEVESLNKVVSSMDEKFKFVLKDGKKKDEFLMNYLKNKANTLEDKDLIEDFFKQYEEVPKQTVSELMKEERQVQEQLRTEVKRLEQQLEFEKQIQMDIHKRYQNRY